jgi:hypothetical protein
MQSNGARIAVLVVAVAAVVVLFAVLSGGDDDGGGTTSVATQPETTTEGRDNGDKDKPKPEPEPQVPLIELVGTEPKGGVTELSVQSGEEVRFDVISDATTEIHVHGYDLYFDVTAGKKEAISFPAELEGAYEIEAHLDPAGDVQIAELAVNP